MSAHRQEPPTAPRTAVHFLKKGTKKTARAKGVAAQPVAREIALVLLEDNRLLREGIAAQIRGQPGFRLIASSSDAEEALRAVREAKPDIVLIDFGLADYDSLSLTATVGAELPETRVVVMGLLATQDDVADYVRAGASGFVMKDATFDQFFATIRAVAAGRQVLPTELTNMVFSHIVEDSVRTAPRRAEGILLTKREQQVVGLLSEGLSNKEIAARLQIAVHTVKSHVHNVLEKLSLRSRLEVAAFFSRHRAED